MILKKILSPVSDALDRVCSVLIVAMLGLMVVITTAQIVCRTFFTSLSWSDEVTRYLLIWSTFLGATCVYRHGGNIAITTSNFLEDDLWVKQRYDGFVDYLKGRSSYRILGLWDTISDEKSAELICQELMEKHPDISGIYDISYKSEAIARRLVRMRRDQDIKLIGFDYYDAVKPFIRSSAIDVIIGQSLPNQAYDAVKMMFYHLCYGVPLVNKDYNSRLDVIVSSNMDYFEG